MTVTYLVRSGNTGACTVLFVAQEQSSAALIFKYFMHEGEESLQPKFVSRHQILPLDWGRWKQIAYIEVPNSINLLSSVKAGRKELLTTSYSLAMEFWFINNQIGFSRRENCQFLVFCCLIRRGVFIGSHERCQSVRVWCIWLEYKKKIQNISVVGCCCFVVDTARLAFGIFWGRRAQPTGTGKREKFLQDGLFYIGNKGKVKHQSG